MKPASSCILTIAILCLTPLAAADDKLDAIEKEVTQKWKSVKSLAADMTTKSSISRGGQVMLTDVTGTFELMRKGDDALYRQEHNATSRISGGGQNTTITAKIVAVYDGEYLYQHQFSEMMGQNVANKRRMDDGGMLAGGENMFRMLRESYNLTVLPDQKVNGHDCWVIEARPKAPNPQPGAPIVMTHYIRKQDGFAVKLAGVNAAGETVLDTVYSNIRVDQPIDPKRFTFVAPDGVTVVDLTSSPTPGTP